MNTTISTAAEIVHRINAEHRACLDAASDALDHAMRAGDLLRDAKAQCDHGQWQNWLAEHFEGSARTARMYMQLAERRAEIEAKRQRDTVLSVAEARRLISAPAKTAGDFDGLFPPELAAIIDAKLNGPFCPDDFTQPTCRHWLEVKVSHQARLPAAAGFALTVDIDVSDSVLRLVPYDDLMEAIAILAPYANGERGFDFTRVSAKHVSRLHILLARMIGSLITELEHRHNIKTNKQYQEEHAAAYAQFSAAMDAKLAELEAAR